MNRPVWTHLVPHVVYQFKAKSSFAEATAGQVRQYLKKERDNSYTHGYLSFENSASISLR